MGSSALLVDKCLHQHRAYHLHPSPAAAVRTTMPDKDVVYTMVAEVGMGDPRLLRRYNLLGVVTSIPKTGCITQRGRHMTMIVIVDPSCDVTDAVRKDFLLFSFFKSENEMRDVTGGRSLQPGDVLLCKSVKVEEHDRKLDGRVFSGRQLTLFSSEPGSPVTPLSRGNFLVSDAERTRVEALRNWWWARQQAEEAEQAGPSVEIANTVTLKQLSTPGLYNLRCEVVSLLNAADVNYIQVRDGTRCGVPCLMPQVEPEEIPGVEGVFDCRRRSALVEVEILDQQCLHQLRQLEAANQLRYLQVLRLRAAALLEEFADKGVRLVLRTSDQPSVHPLAESAPESTAIREALRCLKPIKLPAGKQRRQLKLKVARRDREGETTAEAAAGHTTAVVSGQCGAPAQPARTSLQSETQDSSLQYGCLQEELLSQQSEDCVSQPSAGLPAMAAVPVTHTPAAATQDSHNSTFLAPEELMCQASATGSPTVLTASTDVSVAHTTARAGSSTPPPPVKLERDESPTDVPDCSSAAGHSEEPFTTPPQSLCHGQVPVKHSVGVDTSSVRDSKVARVDRPESCLSSGAQEWATPQQFVTPDVRDQLETTIIAGDCEAETPVFVPAGGERETPVCSPAASEAETTVRRPASSRTGSSSATHSVLHHMRRRSVRKRKCKKV